MRRKRTDPPGISHERWLVSYADFITLLFAFFTTLYAISNVDLQKMHRLMSSLQVAFDTKGQPTGAGKAQGARLQGRPPARDEATAAVTLGALPTMPRKMLDEIGRGYLEASLSGVRQRLTQALSPAIADGRVAIEVDRRGLVVSIRESGSFRTGSAEVSDATRALVGEIGTALQGIDNFVRVEGHTDDVPIHTPRFASNWELSTARATAVVAFLVQAFGIPPDRLSAAGYGEFHPRVPNVDAASRARNRRVDVVILNQTTKQAEEPGVQARVR